MLVCPEKTCYNTQSPRYNTLIRDRRRARNRHQGARTAPCPSPSFEPFHLQRETQVGSRVLPSLHPSFDHAFHVREDARKGNVHSLRAAKRRHQANARKKKWKGARLCDPIAGNDTTRGQTRARTKPQAPTNQCCYCYTLCCTYKTRTRTRRGTCTTVSYARRCSKSRTRFLYNNNNNNNNNHPYGSIGCKRGAYFKTKGKSRGLRPCGEEADFTLTDCAHGPGRQRQAKVCMDG